jgi:hypothetical protein
MRSVEFFNQNNIKIKTLVTDRHTSIRKWIRENMAQTLPNSFEICSFTNKMNCEHICSMCIKTN